MWATTIDLKDAYLHIPIHEECQRYLAFRYDHTDYQFTALPFGLSTAPRVFTRVSRAVVAALRRKGILVFAYIDDWLIASRSQDASVRDTQTTLSLLERLGWIVNRKKSSLVPAQTKTYLGAVLDLAAGKAYPTEERLDRLTRLALTFLKCDVAPAKTWLVLLGIMASLVDILDLCRLHMRPLQVHLLQYYKPGKDLLTKPIPVPEELKPFIEWWTRETNTRSGRPFNDPRPQAVVTTDASLYGWGATWKNLVVQGVWSDEEARAHINVLEAEAVLRALQHWGQHLRGHEVTILSDNSTTVAYINRQGGTRSRPLFQRIWALLKLCEQLQVTLKASHLAGKENTMADALSRGTFQNTEWCLLQSWADHLFQIYDRPQIDLFATAENAKLPTFCCRRFHPRAWKINAFSFPWEGLFFYAFPPWGLIRRVLRKLAEAEAEMILVAPCWPNHPWFPLLLSLLVDLPLLFPTTNQNLITQKGGTIWHRDLNSLHLAAWRVSGDRCRHRAFHQRLLLLQSEQGEGPHLEFTMHDWRSSSFGQPLTLLIPWKRLSSR